MKRYTEEQIAFLEATVPGKTFSEAADLFNEKFSENKSAAQLKELCKRRKIRSGLDLRFRKGCKRTEKIVADSAAPIGTAALTSNGYLKVKVSDSPAVWKLKQIVMWENAFGEIPEGQVLIFLDGNKTNCEIENLRLIPKNQLSRINRSQLKYFDEDSLQSCHLIVELKSKIRKVSKAL